jgi:hypothetical protein
MGIELGAKNLYKAYGVPSLDLTFADKKSLVDRISGNNLITFTRVMTGASVATYVGADGLIKTAGNNVPRFDHNPTTGESLGMLVEEARTNLITYSQAFNNTNYSIGYDGGGFTENATVAPDGTLTASKLTRNTGTSGAFWGKYNRQSIPVTNGTAYTLSCFLKAAEITTVQLYGDVRDGGGLGFSAAFTLTGSGSYVLSSGTSAQISSAGNGWYRCSVTGTSASTDDEEPALLVFGTGASGDGFFAWGFQLEAGSFPTSYIPTTSATVTRAADVASITGTNFSSWYNQSEGTLFAQASLNFSLSTSSVFPSIYEIGGYPNRLWMLYLNGTVNHLTIGSDTHTRNLGTFTSSPQSFKVAQALSNTSLTYSASKDGAAPLTGSLFNAVTGLSAISIGPNVGATKHIARLTFYPVRLPDATLQSLTQ